MPRCEDYPCCGHGPPPYGDGGGCPDSEGRFKCVLCHDTLEKNARSSICNGCLTNMNNDDFDFRDDDEDSFFYEPDDY